MWVAPLRATTVVGEVGGTGIARQAGTTEPDSPPPVAGSARGRCARRRGRRRLALRAAATRQGDAGRGERGELP